MGTKQRHSRRAARTVKRIPVIGEIVPLSIIPRMAKNPTALATPQITLSAKMTYQRRVESIAPSRVSLRDLERYARLMESES